MNCPVGPRQRIVHITPAQLAVHGRSQTPQPGQVQLHRQLLCPASWSPLPVHSEHTQRTQERDQGHSRQATPAPARASTRAGPGKYSSSPHITVVAARRSCPGRPRTCCPCASWPPRLRGGGCWAALAMAEAEAAGRRRGWAEPSSRRFEYILVSLHISNLLKKGICIQYIIYIYMSPMTGYDV